MAEEKKDTETVIDEPETKADELDNRWTGHTHPGTNPLSLIASDGDLEIFSCFPQNNMIIYNSTGAHSIVKK